MKEFTLNGKKKNCTLHSVYDGDSLRLVLPVCCESYIFKCRLNGIDAAELRSRNEIEKTVALETKEFVEQLLKETEFVVECFEFDKYGRVLVNIYLDGSDQSLNDILIEKGLAYKYEGGSKRDFSDWYSMV